MFRRHFVPLITTCRCFEGNRSFGRARLQISSLTITSFTAEFLAKFLLTTSKTHALQLAFIIRTAQTRGSVKFYATAERYVTGYPCVF